MTLPKSMIFFFVLFVVSPGFANPKLAQLKKASEISISGPKGESLKIQEGDIVPVGSTIKVPKGVTAVLSYDNGFKLVIPSKGTLKVTERKESGKQSSTLVELYSGFVRAFSDENKKNRSFHIKTKSAVAGVRGTDFTVEIDENGKTDIRTFEGEVEVANNFKSLLEGKGQRVKPGQFWTHRVGQKEQKIKSFDIHAFQQNLKQRFPDQDRIRDGFRKSPEAKNMTPDGARKKFQKKLRQKDKRNAPGVDTRDKARARQRRRPPMPMPMPPPPGP